MNQIKIGKFIAVLRKEKNLTQRQLADKLDISDKTVSKWETGNGLPEVSLMLPICGLLGISVNELLSGERLSEEVYRTKAEENIMNLMNDKAEAKKKRILSATVGSVTVLSGVVIVMLAALATLPIPVRIALIVISVVVISAGIAVACVLDREAGVFECPKCKELFVPDMKAYVKGGHTLTKRYLKCPKCGESSMCKHKLGK